MPRQTFSWTIEKSKFRNNRTAQTTLTFTWRSERNSFGDTIWFGYDAEGRHQGSVALIDGKAVARAFTPGTLDSNRLGEFAMSPVGMRQAQAAVEAFIGAPAQQVAA